MAAIQPWSAAGAEKPIVTGRPGAALGARGGAALGARRRAAGGVLLVQAASAAPAPRPSAPSRKPRRPRERDGVGRIGHRRPPSSWRVNRVGGRQESRAGAALEQHGGDDDQALGDVLDLGRQVVEDEQVGDRGEHEHAEDRADQRAAAAGQQGPADDHRGDGVELVERAVRARPGRGQRRDHDRRDAAAEPGDRRRAARCAGARAGPASRAASGLPPIANVRRPNVVRLSTHPARRPPPRRRCRPAAGCRARGCSRSRRWSGR